MERAASRRADAENSRQPAVLIADTTPIGATLTSAFHRAGWRAMICQTGSQALDSIRSEPWDVLIVGFRLIDMRGDAVAFAAHAECPTLIERTVVLTADDLSVTIAQAARWTSLPADSSVDKIVAHVVALVGQSSC